MATIVPFEGEGPEFRVYVHSEGDLDLGNVSKFLQRLDTAARYTARSKGVPIPSIQIVSLTTGSLDVRLKLQDRRRSRLALAISAASLAVGVASYMKNDPAAARACKALIDGDNATVIVVDGGGRQEEIRSDDLDAAEQQQVAAAHTPDYELLTGPQAGFIRRLEGEYWVELEARPGLIIRIRDQREERDRLEENARYTLDGEAHISAPRRGESFFLLQHAFLLE